MSKQRAVCTFVAATVTALSLPPMPASAEPEQATPAPAAAPVAPQPVLEAEGAPKAETPSGELAPVEAKDPAAAPLPVATPASGSLKAETASPVKQAVPASGSLLVSPASGSLQAKPASGSVIAAPLPAASASATPVAGPAFTMPNLKLPFPLALSLRPETGSMGGTGFAPGVPVTQGAPAAPAQFNLPSQQTQGWSGTAEVGLGLLSLNGRMTSYGSIGNFDPSISAANDSNKPSSSQLPYYWPESAWTTYVRFFGLRFGYLNEQFNRGIGQEGSIGSLVGGLDSGFNILGLVGVDYHALAGWGVHGQVAPGTTTSHVPAEADASAYVNIGPVNLRMGYVARASFTGDPSTFFAILTNPMSLATDEGKRETVNQTRLGTYMGPYFGAGFTF